MAKKNWLKAIIGIGAVAVAGKVAYDKYKSVKEVYTQEENDSVDDEVKKYNAICDKKIVEVEDEEFTGCEMKSVLSKTVLDLGLATFEKDVYINFSSTLSNVQIILPEGVNVACDVSKTVSGVRNLVENIEEDGINTVYVIGKAAFSSIEIIPVNFYVDDEEDFEDLDADFVDEDDADIIKSVDEAEPVTASVAEKVEAVAEKVADTVETVKESIEEKVDKDITEINFEEISE